MGKMCIRDRVINVDQSPIGRTPRSNPCLLYTSPDIYKNLMVSLRPGMTKDRDDVIRQLVDIQYERNDINFVRGTFRVRGDILEVFPASSSDKAIRIEFFGDEIDRIAEIDVITGEVINHRIHAAIFLSLIHILVPLPEIG